MDIVGDGTAINFQEWRDSSGSVLSSINQYGYATFGRSTGGNAILSLGANTNTVSQMNFASSNGVDLDAPVNGDLWWNGTNLYFFDGNEKIDLLAGGSTGILSNNGLVPDGGYIDVVHGKNTYSVLANGWVCVGGSNDEQCTGGEWVDTGAKVAGIKYVDNPAVWKTNNSIMQYPYISPDGILHSNISDSYNGFHISDFYIGGLAAVDRQTGKLLNAACPKVKGSVSALISDGNGGYYIGGDFTHVGNIPRSNIAHVNADCSLDMNFNPGASGSSGYYDVIKTLLLDKNNNKLYVGGSFNSIGGENIQSLARIDISNGLVDSSFNLNLNSGSNIYTFSLDGSNLYVGGIFNSIGGENRKNLAIVDIFSVSAGILNLDVDGSVNSIFIDSDSDTVYIGGSFSTVGGQSRRSIASITRSTGALKSPISLSCDGTCSVYKIIMNGNTLYVGGYLGSRYDPKSFIAIDLPSGTNTVLYRDHSTSDFAIDGNTIYLNNLKAINATTGDLVHSYEFYSSASTVLLEDNNLYFGGRLRFRRQIGRASCRERV